MPRRARQLLSSRLILTLFIALTVMFAILPPAASAWLGALEPAAVTVLTPISGPVTSLVSSDRVRGEPRDADPALAEVAAQRDTLLQQRLALELENQQLQRVIRELQQGMELNAGMVARQYTTPVVGQSRGSLRVRAGSKQGVLPNAVAVARGVHLVGLVSDVHDRYSNVRLITDRAKSERTSFLTGVVMLTDTLAGPTVQLEERRAVRGETGAAADEFVFVVGDGEFVDPATGRPLPVEVGQVVRLQDETWPRAAQRMIIGRITAVESRPQQQLRRLIVVRPELDLSRLSEVTLRWSDEADRAGPTGAAP